MQLQPAEEPGAGLRRMALEQLAVTRAAFSPPEDEAEFHGAVHAGRKAAKRTRALLRLVRADLGTQVYRNENAVIRDQARSLSDLRIANVLLITVDRLLAAEDSDLPPEVAAALRPELAARLATRAADFRADADGRAAAKTALDCARSRMAAWPGFDGEPAHALVRLVPGITRIYRRGREALQKARRSKGSKALHEWRKQVNYLRYQMEALRPELPPKLQPLASSLEDLSETLGVDHDLADLAATITADPDLLPDPDDRAALYASIASMRVSLQGRALRAGKSIYKRKPSKFAAALTSAWGEPT